jgi:hypothetical protein
VEESEHGRWQGPVLRGERTARQTTTTSNCWRAAVPLTVYTPIRGGCFGSSRNSSTVSGRSLSWAGGQLFGSARTPRDHPMYAAAERLAAKLARAGLAVITGGRSRDHGGGKQGRR